MNGSRITLPLPAWKIAGSPVNTSLTSSGSDSEMNVACPNRIVKRSPYRWCARAMEPNGLAVHAIVCTARGLDGPGGMPEPMRGVAVFSSATAAIPVRICIPTGMCVT